MDREKVIREYENFVNSYVSLVTSEDYEFEMHKAVLALLKEQQERVEPIIIKKEMFDEFYGVVACCPKCDCMWIMYMDNDMHYCPKCGQAVKWE